MGQVGLDVDLDGNRSAQGVGLQVQDALDERSDRGGMTLRRPAEKEIEEVLEDPPGPFALANQRLRIRPEIRR